MHKSMTELQSFGYQAEQAFEAAALGLGYQCHPFSTNFQSEYDFLIDGILPVEVKAARPKIHYGAGRRWSALRWQFNLISLGSNPGQRDFILALACWLPVQQDFTFFLVPSAFLLGRPMWLQVTSHPAAYRGWISRFYGEWSALDFLSARLQGEVNLSLWEGVK